MSFLSSSSSSNSYSCPSLDTILTFIYASSFCFSLNLCYSLIISVLDFSRFPSKLSTSSLKHLPLFYAIALFKSSRCSLLSSLTSFSLASFSGAEERLEISETTSLSESGVLPNFSFIYSSASLL